MSQARIASTNKTGIVYKISIALVLLLGLLIYKLNDYFKNDKTYAMQSQVRKRVVNIKTSVSGQLAQVRNTLSAYEAGLNESNVNWVQLDPFFAIAKVQNTNGLLKVEQLVSRSNTPAERWNASYLEKALTINQSRVSESILVQLFKDRAGSKFMLVRFKTNNGQEIVLAGDAQYFQKYFDIERGNRNASLLVNSEKILAGHTEADYIASTSKEAQLNLLKYIVEQEEIVGTNLLAISYILKSKVAPGFVVPWSIVGVVVGFGFVIVGFFFYSLEPIERRIEKYKKQERAQIYKDTVTAAVSSNALSGPSTNAELSALTASFEEKSRISVLQRAAEPVELNTNQDLVSEFENSKVYNKIEEEVKPTKSFEIIDLLERPSLKQEVTVTQNSANDLFNLTEETYVPQNKKFESDQVLKTESDSFLTLDEEKIDLEQIEKALALDDFDHDEPLSGAGTSEALARNLQPQKYNIDQSGISIDEPKFVFEKKSFKVDEIKINMRRPERS